MRVLYILSKLNQQYQKDWSAWHKLQQFYLYSSKFNFQT